MTDTTTTPIARQATAAKAPRFDMVTTIHKALRQFMAHTLQQLGAVDCDDDEDFAGALAGVESLLGLLKSHLQHENDFIHTAVEARRPGAARHTADDHLLHQESIANLEDEAGALRTLPAGQRATPALRLYRHLAEFIGENLVHMQFEETRLQPTLWELYDDAELMALHDRLVANIPAAEMALVARWMAAALSPAELAALFAGMQAKAPPPAFEALLDVARTQLDERRWARLAIALGRPPVPGLITA